MAFHVVVEETAAAFTVEADESLLDGALRAQVKLPYECTLGNCGTCRVKVVQGEVDYAELPLAISPEEVAQGYALACQARVRSDLVISAERAPLAEPERHTALVTDIAPLGADVVHLSLVLPDVDAFVFRPGQHMNVLLEDGTHRSFSMATPPSGNAIDFHIRRIPGGQFTGATLDALQPGDLLEVELPHGTFRFHEEDYRELLMVATGTGFAPIKCILEALLDDPDCPPVALYWGMRTPADLYLEDEIRAWSERLYEFRYVPVLSRADASWTGRRGHVQQAVLEDFPDLSQHAIYLCGSPAMIHDAKQAFLTRNASIDYMYVDGFSFHHHG